jgi:hypothetical protein
MQPPDALPPRSDLNVVAARASLDAYRAGLARGLTDEAAWREGVEVFAMHHPSWPRPLAEREAARAAGGLVLLDRAEAAGGLLQAPKPLPKALLTALANPVWADPMQSGPPPTKRDAQHVRCPLPWWTASASHHVRAGSHFQHSV